MSSLENRILRRRNRLPFPFPIGGGERLVAQDSARLVAAEREPFGRGQRGAAIIRGSVIELLPHINATFNLVITLLVISAWVAVRRGSRTWHARLMMTAVGVGILFLIGYVTLTLAVGHQRFPGDGAIRTLFLTILVTHTILAVAIVPMVARSVLLAVRDRIDDHRRWVRVTLPVWLYVCVTGLVIYAMNHTYAR